MTVKELIAQLRKLPKDVPIIYQAHDNSENEINDYINRAVLINFDKMKKCSWQQNKGVAVALRS